MGASVERWASILVGAAMVALVGWVTYAQAERHGAPREHARVEGDGGAAVSAAGSATAGGSGSGTGTGTEAGAGGPADLDAGLAMLLGDAGFAMPSGAPRTVHLGVVLVQFQGAEGASQNARNKKDALARAEELRAEAAADFRKAVRDGDVGSSDDVGRIPRGVLDPQTEVAVFSLAAGDVSGVLETPKGYWVVKRLD